MEQKKANIDLYNGKTVALFMPEYGIDMIRSIDRCIDRTVREYPRIGPKPLDYCPPTSALRSVDQRLNPPPLRLGLGSDFSPRGIYR